MSIFLEAGNAVASQVVPAGDYVKFLTEELARHRLFLDESINKLGAFLVLVLAAIGGVATFVGWKSLKDVRESTKEIFDREAKTILNAKLAELNSKVDEIGAAYAAAQKNMNDLEGLYKSKTEGIEKWLIKIEEKAGPQARAETSALPHQSTQPSGGQFRVLWVDDSPSNNVTLIEDFKRRGMEVETVLTTRAALDRLRGGGFDLVISDMGRAEGRNEGVILLKQLRDMNLPVDVIIYAGRTILSKYGGQAADLGALLVTSNPGEVYEFVTSRANKGAKTSS